MAMDDELKQIMSEILEVDGAGIHDEFGPSDSELWDSLNALRMVTAIEEAFGIRLTMDEISHMVSFAKIREAVARHLGGTASA